MAKKYFTENFYVGCKIDLEGLCSIFAKNIFIIIKITNFDPKHLPLYSSCRNIYTKTYEETVLRSDEISRMFKSSKKHQRNMYSV